MNLFRKNAGPSARETFLVAALGAAGVPETLIAEQLAANNLHFLADAAEPTQTLTNDLATVRGQLSTLHAALQTTGLDPVTLTAPGAFAAWLTERDTASRTAGATAAGLAAAAELAARGIPPVATAAAAPGAGAGTLAAQYEAITDPRARAAFIGAHGTAAILSSLRQSSN